MLEILYISINIKFSKINFQNFWHACSNWQFSPNLKGKYLSVFISPKYIFLKNHTLCWITMYPIFLFQKRVRSHWLVWDSCLELLATKKITNGNGRPNPYVCPDKLGYQSKVFFVNIRWGWGASWNLDNLGIIMDFFTYSTLKLLPSR